ncbi:MAG: IS200/IS605 family transposase [Solobacterium sp.]|nr:IS200/IS605 family transposase [Solobacterium sp.]MCR5229036.1 IS200/IS605 family transposase [Solobacterium sp.]
MKSEYRSTETTVYCCRYHVIFCPKYRRKVLREPIAQRFKEIVLSMQEEQNFYVLEMEVMPDHVHLLLDVDPTIGINILVSRIKGKTAHILNREFPELERKLPTLWTRSKFIATVGSVSLDVVKKYIEDQKTNESRRKK